MKEHPAVLAKRSPRKSNATREKTLFGIGVKITLALAPEEVALARSLARIISLPGRALNVQDVFRIALANLGNLHEQGLAVGTGHKQ